MERILAGSVTLFREQCPNCGETNLSGKKIFECECGYKYYEQYISYSRVLLNKHKRKDLRHHIPALLARDGNKCYWCGHTFGKMYLHRKRVKKLKITIDHIVPYGFSQNDSLENLCVACSICNGRKSGKMFASEDDCRKYLSYTMEKSINTGLIIFEGQKI